MSTPPPALRCAVVVPVKPPAFGKSRLVGLSDEQRRDLAEAFALDTVQAASATPGVFSSVRCTRAWQAAQVIPVTGMVTTDVVGSVVFVEYSIGV